MTPPPRNKSFTEDRLGDYVEVKHRIVEFRTKYPTGCLRPANLDRPYDIVLDPNGNVALVVVTMAAYRTPDDPLPGIGSAWQPVPGVTPFTKGSELMNAETSASGRAMINALAVDASKSIASADEVQLAQDNNTVDPAMLSYIVAWRELLRSMKNSGRALDLMTRLRGVSGTQPLNALSGSALERMALMMEDERDLLESENPGTVFPHRPKGDQL